MRSRRKVAVTGATGFVGGRLVETLLEEGASVTALVRDRRRADQLGRRGVRLVEGPLADRAAVQRACGGQDVVVHCAARAADWGPLDAFLHDNVQGTRNVAEAALAGGCGRFVHLSTISVYGFDPLPVVTEDTPPAVLAHAYPYGESKRRAEEVVAEAGRRGLQTVVLRVGSVYGPGSLQWTLRPAKLARRKLGLVLVDGGRGLHNHVYIDNLIGGIQLAMEHPAAAGGVFNLTDGEPTPYGRFFRWYVDMVRGEGAPMVDLGRRRALALAWLSEKVAARKGTAPPMTRIAVRLLMRRSAIRSERAMRTLGYAPRVGLEEGMVACRRWLADEGILRTR
ncbi:MAG: NAD-dependent epimerase/dehydratase family protein [Myxococcota bacterium]